MSLPSIASIAQNRGFDLNKLTPDQSEQLLLETMQTDLPDACNCLRDAFRQHVPGQRDPIIIDQDPNSVVGKQLIRIVASDAMRPIATKHLCGGESFVFVNCCKILIGGPAMNHADIMVRQIHNQSGHEGRAHC